MHRDNRNTEIYESIVHSDSRNVYFQCDSRHRIQIYDKTVNETLQSDFIHRKRRHPSVYLFYFRIKKRGHSSVYFYTLFYIKSMKHITLIKRRHPCVHYSFQKTLTMRLIIYLLFIAKTVKI